MLFSARTLDLRSNYFLRITWLPLIIATGRSRVSRRILERSWMEASSIERWLSIQPIPFMLLYLSSNQLLRSRWGGKCRRYRLFYPISVASTELWLRRCLWSRLIPIMRFSFRWLRTSSKGGQNSLITVKRRKGSTYWSLSVWRCTNSSSS